MIEREGNQAQTPLFDLDKIPAEIKHREADILQTFDGSIESRGITMTLNPITGEVIRGRFFDLLSRKVASYEPLARGKWCSPTYDLKEGSPEYEKLDRVYQDVRDKFFLWKVANPRPGPMREWTTIKGKSYENSSGPKIIHPEKWFEEVSITLVVNPDTITKEEKKPKEKPTYKRPSRQKTGYVKRSNIRSADIASSKEAPRLADARPAPLGYRRNADRDIKKALKDKGTLGKRIRRAIRK